MSTLLSTIVGGGDGFVTRAIGSSKLSAGSGVLLTVTPPAGQRVKVTHISTLPTKTQANVVLKFGGTPFISGGIINGESPAVGVNFSVGSYYPYDPAVALEPPASNHKSFTGGVNEEFEFSLSTGSLANFVYIGYELGE